MTEHRLRIDAMGRRGEGLAGAGQQRLFIAGALPGLGGRDWLLTFYCAGRRMHFGAAASDELGRLAATTGVGALAGALSLGEITTSAEFGIPEFHNAAIVCL